MESPLMSPHEGLLFEARERIASLEAENARLTAALVEVVGIMKDGRGDRFPSNYDVWVRRRDAFLAAHGGGK